MVRQRKIRTPGVPNELEQAQDRLYKKVGYAPRPLPPGRFPQLLKEGEKEGFDRDQLLNVLDLWLNYGFCRIIDPISQDIELTPAGEKYFY